MNQIRVTKKKRLFNINIQLRDSSRVSVVSVDISIFRVRLESVIIECQFVSAIRGRRGGGGGETLTSFIVKQIETISHVLVVQVYKVKPVRERHT